MKTPISRLSRPQSANSASDTDETFLIAYYPCSEASGNIVDSGPNAMDLATGTAPTAAADLITNSGSTGCRVFNGSTQYLRSGDFGDIATRVGGLYHTVAKIDTDGTYTYLPNTTIDFWCYPDTSFGSALTAVYWGGTDAGTTGATNRLFTVKRNGTSLIVEYEYGPGTVVTHTSTLTVASTRKCFVQVAIGNATNAGDNGYCNVYMRVWQRGSDSSGLANYPTFIGEEVWEDEFRPNTSGRFTYLAIGGNYDGTGLWDGSIQDVRISQGCLPVDNGHFQALLGCATWNEAQLYANGTSSAHLKVFVEDGDEVMRDLTDAMDQDFVVSASWSDEVDTLVTSANIKLARAHYNKNLSPEDADSPLNLNGSGIYDPLLELNRKVLIKVAVVPQGYTPADTQYVTVWDGIITSIDFGSPEIQIGARDPGMRLERAWIEQEDIYGLLDKSTVYWDSSSSNRLRVNSIHNFELNDTFYVTQTSVATSGTRYVHSTGTGYVRAANASASEDSGPCTPIAEATQEVNRMLRLNNFNDYISIRNDPDWFITGWKQDTGPMLSAMDNIAAQVGDNIRYIWSDYHQRHNLEWYRVNRAATTMATISHTEYYEFTRASTSIDDIRNVCQVSYGDREDLSGYNLARPLNSYSSTNATSVTRYGRAWCSLHNVPNIDTEAEATTLADAVVSDLAEPEILYTCRMPYRRTVELGDVYTFTGNGVQFSEDVDLAVCSIQHDFSGGAATTTLGLKGKPVGRYKGWFRRFISTDKAQKPEVAVPDLQGLDGQLTIDGLIRLQWQPYQQLTGAQYRVAVYKSEVSGFTPSQSNLQGIYAYNTAFVLINGYTGINDWYFKAAIVDQNNNYGAFSEVYVDTTVEAQAVIVGAGSPYRNNIAYQTATLLLNENTAAVTEYIDTGTIFTKASANGRFTIPFSGYYKLNLQCDISDYAGSTGYLFSYILKYNSGGVLQNTYYSGLLELEKLGATGTFTQEHTFSANSTDYLLIYIKSDGGSSFTFDISTAYVMLTLVGS